MLTNAAPSTMTEIKVGTGCRLQPAVVRPLQAVFFKVSSQSAQKNQ